LKRPHTAFIGCHPDVKAFATTISWLRLKLSYGYNERFLPKNLKYLHHPFTTSHIVFSPMELILGDMKCLIH